MSSINAPINYTNKDFVSIYEELLNLGKELSYKWDPTQTNESDPGLVLIKEKAIVGDKNNYNIDKNILQAFPDTVTEEKVARQLFAQLGYKMPWYLGATTKISFKWIGETLNESDRIEIPKYSMVTDSESKYVYTIVEPVLINRTTKNYTVSVNAIQGIYTQFKVSGNSRITTANIDYNNRLYLEDYNIAQNGIFIQNIDSTESNWEQVDNIQLYSSGSYIYEFNVDPSTNMCYIEFPKDYEELIGSGINVSYILTDGENGNVSSKVIDTFYNDVTITFRNESIVLNEENIKFYNTESASNGSNPDSLTAAYNGYKKTVGTFNTLVTLRDYINSIYNSGLVSNVQVSDRFHDIQTTYQILTDRSGINTLETYFLPKGENNSISFQKILKSSKPTWTPNTYYTYSPTIGFQLQDSEPQDWNTNYFNYYVIYQKDVDLTAYDLRLYLLKSSGTQLNLSSYKRGFELEPSNSETSEKVKSYINESQCVSHDFKDILPNIPCMFRNIFPLNIKIIPQYKLNDTQQLDLQLKIFSALIESLQAKNMNFGEEPNYEFIYNTILDSDSRIKTIILDDFIYTTYAVYWDVEANEFKYVPVSDFNDANIIVRDTKADLQDLVDNDTNIVDDIKNTIIEPKYNYLYIAKYGDHTGPITAETPVSYTCYIYPGNDDSDDKESGGIETTLIEYSDKIQEFRKDIISKNVLAGNTTLFKQDNQFKYNILQNTKEVQQDVGKVTTELQIAPMGGVLGGTGIDNIDDGKTIYEITPAITDYPGDPNSQGSYVLKENESVQIYGPSFRTITSYSNYIKFLLVLENATGFTYEPIPSQSIPNLQISLSNPVYIYDDDEDTYVRYTSNAVIDYDKEDGSTGTGNIKAAAAAGYIIIYKRVESRDILLNTEYELRGQDKLYIFYRDVDEDNAPYRYRVYEAGKIVKPNFTLIANSLTDTLTDGITVKQLVSNVIGTSGNIIYSPDPRSPFGVINSFYGDRNLSGTKTLELRELNETEFKANSGRRYYWVTNTTSLDGDKKYYSLTLNKVSEDSNVIYEYILKNNEYFIHTDPEFTSYEILGSGTLIRYIKNKNSETESSSITEKVEVVENYLIETEGLPAFQAQTITLTAGNILVREQQVYNLVENNRIIITLGKDYYEPIPMKELLTFNSGGEIPRTHNLTNKNKVDANSIRCEDSSGNDVKFTMSTEDNGYIVSPSYLIDELVTTTTNSDPQAYVISMDPAYIMNYTPGVYYHPEGSSSHFPDYKLATEQFYDDFKEYVYVPMKPWDATETVDTNTYYYFILNNNIYKNITSIPETSTGEIKYVKKSDIKTVTQFQKGLYYSENGGNYTLLTTLDSKDYDSEIVEGESVKLAYKTCYILNNIEKAIPDSTQTIYYINKLTPSIVNVYYNEYTPTNTPVLNSTVPVTLKGADIAYSEKPEDYAPITPLPSIDLSSGDNSWKVTATLNLNSGPDTTQKVITEQYSNDKVISTQLYCVSGKALNKNNETLSVNTNVDLQLPGGKDVDVSYVDILGSVHNINILPYKEDGNQISVNAEGNIVINIFNNLDGLTPESGKNEIEKIIELNVEGIDLSNTYNYILPIRNNDTEVSYKLNVETTADINEELSSYELGKYYNNDVQYYMFRINNSEPRNVKFKLTLKCNKDAKLSTLSNIIIYPLVRYVDTSIFDKYSITVDELIKNINRLDKDKIFKWDYIIPQGTLIKNPLDPKSFFSENHTCNSFTLGNAELDFYSIGSQFDIINNR